MRIYKKDNSTYYEDSTLTFSETDLKLSFDDVGSGNILITIRRQIGVDYDTIISRRFPASEITDFYGEPYGDTVQDILLNYNKGIDVNQQDQTTDDVFVKFNQVQEATTLALPGSINDKTITLTSATGTAAGKYIVLFHPESARFTPFHQVGAAAGNVITLDNRLDFDYPAGTFVDIANTNMAIDGSVTPQTFGLRGTGIPPGVDITFDMTRIIVSCLTESAVSLSEFCSIPALIHGLEFRLRNGRFHNSFNIKSNREIDAIFGTDWKPYAAINPSQGQDGFTARLTFASMGKVGVAKRMPLGEDYEITVQDDLTVDTQDITLLEVFAEGHITNPL